MDKKPYISMALEERCEFTVDRRPPTFQTLPLDIKFIIFSHLLPRHGRIIYLTGQADRHPTYGALSQACHQLRLELTYWFTDSQRLQRAYTKTLQYGLISRDTHFALRITDAFRDLELCKVDETAAAAAGTATGLRHVLIPECSCCTKFRRVLAPPDFAWIRSLALHFKTEDGPGRRDNLNAIKRLPHIPNLAYLDFLLGDRGRCWAFCKEEWGWERKEEAKVWIPTSRNLVAVLKARVAFPDEIVMHVWLVVSAEEDEKDQIELLCSWPEGEGEGRSYSVEELSSGLEVD